MKEASELIKDRGASYGSPQSNYSRLAKMVSGCFKHKLKEDLTGSDCILIMQLVKVCREAHKPKQDNRDDGRGYWDVLDLYLNDDGGKDRDWNLFNNET